MVDKTRKINEEPSNMENYDVIAADTINSTAADLYEYASAQVYGKLDSTQSKTMDTNKVCGPNKSFEYFFGNVNCQKPHSVFIVSCLIVLINAGIAAAIAVAMSFVLIAGLHSD